MYEMGEGIWHLGNSLPLVYCYNIDSMMWDNRACGRDICRIW